jgi:ribosomal protein S27E
MTGHEAIGEIELTERELSTNVVFAAECTNCGARTRFERPQAPSPGERFEHRCTSCGSGIRPALGNAQTFEVVSTDQSDGRECRSRRRPTEFSYHLAELTPHFVQETTEGYAIRDAGRRIVESVKSGEHTVKPTFERVRLTTHCPDCGETAASATYDGRLATVDCQSCSRTLMRYELRPAHVANRSSREALIATDRQIRAEYESALDGICQRCGGTVSVELHTEVATTGARASIACECDQCDTTYTAPVEVALLTHPPGHHSTERGRRRRAKPPDMERPPGARSMARRSTAFERRDRRNSQHGAITENSRRKPRASARG